jgi:threonine/homoserine/homoserine lactone efflux protein
MFPLTGGFLLGFAISMPIGPVNVALFNLTIKRGWGSSIWMALGAALMDGLYLGFFLAGASFITLPDSLLQVLYGLGILLLFVLGIREMLAKPPADTSQLPIPQNGVRYTGLGVLFYVTNPGFPIFFASLAMWLHSNPLLDTVFTFPNSILAAIGTCLGSLVWFSIYIRLIEKLQTRINAGSLALVNRLSGAILSGAAVWLFIRNHEQIGF